MEQDLLNNLNLISEKLFKNMEGQAYELLDKIVTIGPKIIKEEPLSILVKNDNINYLNLIATTLMMFYIIYYILTKLISIYNGSQSESVFSFIIKLLVISLLISNSYYLCNLLLEICELLTNCISQFIEEISGKEATFENLKETIINIKDFMKSDILSVNGLIKGILSFGIINILISFSIRYVKVIFLILVSPFMFVFLASDLTKGIFNSWIKQLVINLSLQIVVKLVILIPLLYKDVDSIMFKIILLGTIYILYRINDLVSTLFQSITTFRRG